MQSENNALALKMNLRVKKSEYKSFEFINELLQEKPNNCVEEVNKEDEQAIDYMKYFRSKLRDLRIFIKEFKQTYSAELIELKKNIQELNKIYNNDLHSLCNKKIEYWYSNNQTKHSQESNYKQEVDKLKVTYKNILLESSEQIKKLEEENKKYKVQIAKGLEEYLMHTKLQEENNKLIEELKQENTQLSNIIGEKEKSINELNATLKLKDKELINKHRELKTHDEEVMNKLIEGNKKVRELLTKYYDKNFKVALNNLLKMCNQRVENIIYNMYKFFKERNKIGRSRQEEYKFSRTQSYIPNENEKKQEFLVEFNRLRKANLLLKREVESSIAKVKNLQNTQSESDIIITELKGQSKKWMQNLKICIQEFRKVQTELEKLKAERITHLNQIRELKERQGR